MTWILIRLMLMNGYLMVLYKFIIFISIKSKMATTAEKILQMHICLSVKPLNDLKGNMV